MSTKQTDQANGADKLAEFIMHVHTGIMASTSTVLRGAKLSYQQYLLLNCLMTEDYLTQTDVSKKLAITTAAATGQTTRLEKLGFVRRFHDTDDRRKICSQITKKGIRLVKKVQKETVKWLTEQLEAEDDGRNIMTVKSFLTVEPVAMAS